MWVEILGYAAFIFFALSMLMVSIVRLRVINLIGALFFALYGLFLPSVPIFLTNLFIVGVNIYYLGKAFRSGRSYCDYVPAGPERRMQIQEYINAHLSRIKKFYPFFEGDFLDLVEKSQGQVYMAIHQVKVRGLAMWIPLREIHKEDVGNYAGLKQAVQAAHKLEDGHNAALLLLDYIDTKYRDLNLHPKLYSLLNRLHAEGYDRIVAVCSHDVIRTRNYLKARGFQTLAEFSGLDLMELPLPFH